MVVGTVVQEHRSEFATTHNQHYSNNIPAEQKHAVRGYTLFKHRGNGVRGESQLSHTRRIYNDTKQWFKIKITSWSDGYEDGMFGRRNDGYHPYHQYDTFHCKCAWCKPKSKQHGSIRVRRKFEIEKEISGL